jgi:hypothetical protein
MSEILVVMKVHPVGSQTLESIESSLPDYVEQAAREDGMTPLLDRGELKVQVKDKFPTDQVVLIVVTLVGQAALEYYKYHLKKKLQDKYDIVIVAEPKERRK